MGYGSDKKRDLSNPQHTSAATVKEALDTADEILRMIEEDLSERTKTGHSADFIESVIEGVKGVHETISNNNWVSEKQLTALKNWKEAIDEKVKKER